MQNILSFFAQWRVSLFGYDSAARIVLCAVLFLCGLFGARWLRKLADRLHALWAKHEPAWLGIVWQGFREPFVLALRFVLWALAVFAFPWPTGALTAVYALTPRVLRLTAVILLSLGLWRSSALCGLLMHSARNRLDLDTSKTMSIYFEKMYRALVLLFAFILILSEFGFDVSGVVAGAGLAGLAISLAAQSTVSNLICGIALVLERPFGIGDWVRIGTSEGTVEDISFRTTRLRTIEGSLVSLENSVVCAQTLENQSNRTARLIRSKLGILYSTPKARIVALCAALRALLCALPEVDADTVEVNLTQFTDSAIELELRCCVNLIEIKRYRAFLNELNLAILDTMEENGCAFAFPSTSVYFENALPRE